MNSILIAALCCGSISFTITFTSLFKPLRDWIGSFHPKLDELIHCPWCFNHYVVFVYMIVVVDLYGILDFLVHWFAIIGLGGIVHYVLLRAYEPVAKALTSRKIENAKNNRSKSIETSQNDIKSEH